MARQKSFKNMTKREQFILFFHGLGYRPVASRSGKYMVYSNNIQYIFLGKAGAVRVNSKNSATGSQSYTPHFTKVMENWAHQHGYQL